MEREKQIYDAGQLYSDSMDEFQRYHTYPRGAFIDGAKWADEHPNKELVNKQEFIEKAKKWLEKTLYIHTEINDDEWCFTPLMDWVTSDYDSVEDFINGFCKAMEK